MFSVPVGDTPESIRQDVPGKFLYCPDTLAFMFEDTKYILLTTYRRDGTPVKTPVWITPLENNTFGFWTSSGSGKAKRLAHTQRVEIQPCDARGKVKPSTEPIAATAQLVTGPEFEAIRKKIVAKYGAMTKITKALAKIGGIFKGKTIPYGDRGVVLTLN